MIGSALFLAAVVIASVAGPGAAVPPAGRGASVPTVEAMPVPSASAIRLDGDLTEEVWQRAPVISGFVQREPSDGQAAAFPTEARVAYDREAIYVAVWAHDPEPGRIAGFLTRRDSSSPSDWIRVAIDSYHDHKTAYQFGVNPAGVKQDVYMYDDTSEDSSWDAVWDVEVQRGTDGWRAEFRIPFSQLRFRQSESGTFGLAVAREVVRLKETSSWPHLPKSASGLVSSFGDLTGLVLDQSARRLEVAPYVVGQLSTQPRQAGNPFVHSRDPGSTLGADLKYAMTPGLTLTATVNPDFGQVEADPAVVNLSAFETLFEERRPFFVEGSGTFRFDLDCNDGECTGLFYSRRIGRSPHGAADTPDGGYSESPAQTTIVGAAKVTGRAGPFSVGVMNAVTSGERAQIALGASRSTQAIEPLTGYTVGRARREFANRSTLGFMATSTNRRLVDGVRFLPGQAYTGGVDWDWRLRASRYSLGGYWAASTVRGSAEAISGLQRNNVHSYQRPDAGHVELDETRTALSGHAGRIAFSKIAGERVRFASNVLYKTPGFDVNDVGYLQRADQITASNWVQIRDDKPGRFVRTYRVNFNQWLGRNFDGDLLFTGGNVNMHWVFTSNWRFSFGVNYQGAGIADRATRGGPALRTNPGMHCWIAGGSDDRRRVSFELVHFYYADRKGSEVFEAGPVLVYRPSPALSVSGGVVFNRNLDDYQWVGTVTDPRDHYVFGRIDQTTVSVTARVNYTITPALSVQLYARPFVSAGAYSSFREVTDGRAARYADRFAPFAYDGNPDFNHRSFRTTNVLRWEYRPGSTLFVVWQQGREDAAGRGDFRFGRDVAGAFEAPAQNMFLVKLAHWFNF